MTARRLSLVAVLALVPLATSIAPTDAAVPTCHGLAATIIGTAGPNKLVGTDGPDVAVLGAGNDRFSGKGGNDVVCGGDGADEISGGNGDDTIHGGNGTDRIYEGQGDDQLDGGAGADTLDYTYSRAEGLRLDARSGKATSSTGSDSFDSFSVFFGTSGTDTLIGSDRSEWFYGRGGAEDVVHGLGGDDHIRVIGDLDATIWAGAGNDTVEQNGGTARIHLGDGDDRVEYFYRAHGSSWAGGPGADTIYLRWTYDSDGFVVDLPRNSVTSIGNAHENWPAFDFENVIGSQGPDRLIGNAESNDLVGRDGGDTLLGRAGDDELTGGFGYDTAVGGVGTDRCSAEVVSDC